jgi:hypothetical protein
MLLCLLACAAQSFVVQTHVHASPVCEGVSQPGQVCAADSGSVKHAGGHPGCPLCQVALHGAAAPLAPHALPIPLLAQSAFRAPEHPAISLIAAVSYYWQSRGPPFS